MFSILEKTLEHWSQPVIGSDYSTYSKNVASCDQFVLISGNGFVLLNFHP